jgi:predicted RNA-binding Zn ribbon-like protein
LPHLLRLLRAVVRSYKLIAHYIRTAPVRSQVEFRGYALEAVDLAVDLVNTYNAFRQTDELTDGEALESFLREHKRTDIRITDRDLDEVRELRGQLRTIFQTHDQRGAAAAINSLLEESGALPRLTDHDGSEWHLHYTTPNVPLAQELTTVTGMGLAVLMSDKRWDRIHVCEGDRCLDVFVDHSKNRSRRFCSPEVCGNRASVAAYRQRARAGR